MSIIKEVERMNATLENLRITEKHPFTYVQMDNNYTWTVHGDLVEVAETLYHHKINSVVLTPVIVKQAGRLFVILLDAEHVTSIGPEYSVLDPNLIKGAI